MAGELQPLVMLPRYSTFAGEDTYYTIAMDVTEFQAAILNVWRGKNNGTSPTFTASCEESVDQVNWTACANGSTGSMGQSSEVQVTATITKRWFRLKIVMGGTNPVITCWAVGFLEQRQQ